MKPIKFIKLVQWRYPKGSDPEISSPEEVEVWTVSDEDKERVEAGMSAAVGCLKRLEVGRVIMDVDIEIRQNLKKFLGENNDG